MAIRYFKGDKSKSYIHMQEVTYDVLSSRDAKRDCVGSFEEHENYPYKEFLLRKYNGDYSKALDFGCGIGRMIKRFEENFDRVDGVDISENNLLLAKEYCKTMKTKPKLYKTDGMHFSDIKDNTYDFIYSTIAMEHIAPFSVRFKIFEEIYRTLKRSGSISIQMNYVENLKKHYKYFPNSEKLQPLTGISEWREDATWATRTNSQYDVKLDKDSLGLVRDDLKSIGFVEIDFLIESPPHKGVDYFVFIYAKK
tara:strand:+ start:347 stop:1102 length:756 start_codon:yes stop_codon:yes gene_type:complete